jgi:CRP-like cAMP-binding protein
MVGEMAFVDGARRAADVVTEGEVETAALAISDFVGLQQTHSVLHTKILRNIAVSLSMKLRKVNQDVSVLASARD